MSPYDLSAWVSQYAPHGEALSLAYVVRERAISRAVLTAAARIQRKAADPTTDAFDALDALREAHDDIAGHLPGRAMVSQREALATLAVHRANPDAAGTQGRLHALNQMTGGWKPGKLYIGAGRPAMGKSGFAKSEALHVARQGKAAAVFTLEMEADEFAERTEAEHAALMARPNATPQDLADLPLFYHDAPRLTTNDLRARLYRLQREPGVPPLGLVVVDYLQLMQGRGDNREQEVASISRDLKVIAREFRVPILALSQLSRKCEERGDKRPMLSDIRESGAVEQDADVVLFFFRPAYYRPGCTAEVNGMDEYAGDETDSLCEVIVAKQRRGPTGSAWARFHGPTTSFRDFNEPRPLPPGHQTATFPEPPF